MQSEARRNDQPDPRGGSGRAGPLLLLGQHSPGDHLCQDHRGFTHQRGRTSSCLHTQNGAAGKPPWPEDLCRLWSQSPSGLQSPFSTLIIQCCINEQPDFRETGHWGTSSSTRPHLACPTARPESKGPAALWALILGGPHPALVSKDKDMQGWAWLYKCGEGAAPSP